LIVTGQRCQGRSDQNNVLPVESVAVHSRTKNDKRRSDNSVPDDLPKRVVWMANHCFASTAKATIKPRNAKKKNTIAVTLAPS
jgi:hypothetical protein